MTKVCKGWHHVAKGKRWQRMVTGDKGWKRGEQGVKKGVEKVWKRCINRSTKPKSHEEGRVSPKLGQNGRPESLGVWPCLAQSIETYLTTILHQ